MAVVLPPSGEVGEDRYQPLAEINVTPMVDVMLVLLVIFMVTARYSPSGCRSICRRRAAALTEPKPPVIFSLNRSGELYIGDERIEPGDLETALRAGRGRSKPHRLCGRPTISYAQLMEVLGIVNRAGFAKVSLVAEAAGSK